MSGAGPSTVLVVDDDKTVCDLIRSILTRQGYQTDCVCNGREALDFLRRTPRHPGLILLDLMMPVMTGWEFRKAQQEDPELSGIPVAIITGMLDEDGKAKALSVGAVDVLCKPSRVEEITDLVSRFCK